MAQFQRAQLTLRVWVDCALSMQKQVLAWSDHPDVPEHARTIVAAAIARQHRLSSHPEAGLDIHNWIAFDGDYPVAFLTSDIRSEWALPEEFCPSGLYVDVAGPTMSFSTLVDPELWGNGYSTAAKLAAIDHPVAVHARSFHAEVRADNERSLTAMAKIPGVQMIGTSVAHGHQWLHFRWHGPNASFDAPEPPVS